MNSPIRLIFSGCGKDHLDPALPATGNADHGAAQRRQMTAGDHKALIDWASQYWMRANANSHGGHLRLFEGFEGEVQAARSRSNDVFLDALKDQRAI
jgi:hypothetical protein